MEMEEERYTNGIFYCAFFKNFQLQRERNRSCGFRGDGITMNLTF